MLVSEKYNHLLRVRVDHQGVDQWIMTPEFTKKSHASNNGHYMFRGDDEAFRRYLIRVKATDTDSDPPSYRNVKYKDMVQKFKEPRRTYMWVYSSKWKSNLNFKEMSMKQLKDNQQSHEDFLDESKLDILGAVLYDIFLFGKSDKLMMNNLKREYDGIIGKKLILEKIEELDINLNYSNVFDVFMEYHIKIT